jgi:hypothetical protein
MRDRDETLEAGRVAAALEHAEEVRMKANGTAELLQRPPALHPEFLDDQSEADGVLIARRTFELWHGAIVSDSIQGYDEMRCNLERTIQGGDRHQNILY